MYKKILLGLLTTSAFAYAADEHVIGGVFIGIQGGLSTPGTSKNMLEDALNSESTPPTVTSASSSGNDNGYGGLSIGFDFPIDTSEHVSLGLETGFNYQNSLVEYTAETGSGSITSTFGKTFMIPILATFKTVLPVGLSFVLKAGASYIQQEISYSGTTSLLTEQPTKTNKFTPTFAAGVGWQFQKFNISALYTRTLGTSSASDINNGTPLSMNLYALQLTYTFEVQDTQWWQDNSPNNIIEKQSVDEGL
jgi:hypothetical protein